MTVSKSGGRKISKREFIRMSGIAAGAGMLTSACGPARLEENERNVQPVLDRITDDAAPIAVEERLARIAKAQALMSVHDIAAIIVEPGSAMLYFSGIRWWRSER